MNDAIETIEQACSAETIKIAIVCSNPSHMKLVRFLVESTFLRIGDESHFDEIAYNVFEIYNGSLIYILRPEQCWKLEVDHTFLFESENGKNQAIRTNINNIKDLILS